MDNKLFGVTKTREWQRWNCSSNRSGWHSADEMRKKICKKIHEGLRVTIDNNKKMRNQKHECGWYLLHSSIIQSERKEMIEKADPEIPLHPIHWTYSVKKRCEEQGNEIVRRALDIEKMFFFSEIEIVCR